MTTYGKLVGGMHHWNVTQIGSGYDGKYHYSHDGYEIDLAGSDSGIDYWRNLAKEVYWKCAGAFGTRSTGNTRFFWSCDKNGNAKKVLCADDVLRLTTIALTHSNRDFAINKVYGYNEVMYQEGTSGYATGNHIHMEICAGHVKTKVRNSKGGYNLANMLNAAKVMFLLENTTVVRTGGLTWKKTKNTTYETSSGTTSKKTYKEVKEPRYHIGSYLKRTLTTKCALKLRSTNKKTDDSNKICVIPKDTELEYYGFYDLAEESGKYWIWIKYGNKTGFVYGKSDYLTNYSE